MPDIVKLRVGFAGPAGPQGNRGVSGASAYDTWLATGNTGTEADFLAALKGNTGATGEQGPAGQDGSSNLPTGTEGQFIGYGPNGVPVAVDPPSGGYDDSALVARVDALEGATLSYSWAEIADKPAVFDPAPHSHPMGEVNGLSTALAAKADASAVMTTEDVQDLVAAMFQGGTQTNAAIAYDDASGTLSITASGPSATLSQEEVEDFVGGVIQGAAGISVIYDDSGNVLTISLTGVSFSSAEKAKLAGIATAATANATDAALRDRSTHTGTQAISTVTGLQTALDGKLATAAFTGLSAIHRLTQAEYDALTRDPATLYVIAG